VCRGRSRYFRSLLHNLPRLLSGGHFYPRGFVFLFFLKLALQANLPLLYRFLV
jgi:hypothetical protein